MWITFDKWASRLLGLDESKYEWAKIENELMEQERLYELANDSLAATKQVCQHRRILLKPGTHFLSWILLQLSDMETGSLSEQPEASMEMMRSTPEINHQSTT